jgi:hypothetical protein
MTMRRPQFSLKTLLWLMAVVAAFFAGSAWQWQRITARYFLIQLQHNMDGLPQSQPTH